MAVRRPTRRDLCTLCLPELRHDRLLKTRFPHPTVDGSSSSTEYEQLTYDAASNVTNLRQRDGNGIYFTYDALNRVTLKNLGRRTSLTRGNGTTATYGYDNASRLSQLVENMAGTSHDLTLGFAYNPASQIATNTRSNNLYSFTAHANESTASTINGLNQVVTNGGATLTHDNRGNMTNDGSKAYGYNLESMLTSAPGVTMTYDSALRLHQVTGATTTRFLFDGADTIGEYGPTNALQRRYVHGPGLDEPLVWYEGTGTADRRFLHADERGSIVAISNSAGTVIQVNTYDEYGRPGPGNDGLFQYTGQKYIEEAGLYDYKARMYHPGLGRFMQADPIGYASGINLYAYVRGDPVNFVDPSGLFFEPFNWHVLARDPVRIPGPTVIGNPGRECQACKSMSLSEITLIAMRDAFMPRGAPPTRQGAANPSARQQQGEKTRECNAFQRSMEDLADAAADVSGVAADLALAGALAGVMTKGAGKGLGDEFLFEFGKAILGKGFAVQAAKGAAISGGISLIASALSGQPLQAVGRKGIESLIDFASKRLPTGPLTDRLKDAVANSAAPAPTRCAR